MNWILFHHFLYMELLWHLRHKQLANHQQFSFHRREEVLRVGIDLALLERSQVRLSAQPVHEVAGAVRQTQKLHLAQRLQQRLALLLILLMIIQKLTFC
jgi:hypothetical protein